MHTRSERFTAGAKRAIQEAARWQRALDNPKTTFDEMAYEDRPPISLLAMLLGLFDQPECKAARLLSEAKIDQSCILDTWSSHKDLEKPTFAVEQPKAFFHWEFTTEVEDALQRVESHLWAMPQPLELATEHLLFGLLLTEGKLSQWLLEQGLSRESVEAEVQQTQGYDPTPIDIDWLEDVPSQEKISSSSVVKSTFEESPTASVSNQSLEDETKRGQVLRLIDAAANRAREALRVLEDFARFVLDDAFLCGELKQARHGFETAMKVFPMGERLRARETEADVGTRISTRQEQSRAGLAEILHANANRFAEAVRSSEEYSKWLAPEVAPQLEALRYRMYTLHRAMLTGQDAQSRLREVQLYVLLDAGPSEEVFVERVKMLLAAPVDAIQLRIKNLPDGEVLQRARLLRRLMNSSKALFIMNDRPDLAVLAEADGVHVGQEELSVKDARTIVGPRRLVGLSTHSIEQARQGVLAGADYLGVGPTFPSETKQFSEFAGLSFLKEVAAEIALPAFAIGGITLENLPQVLQTGLQRVAVSGGIHRTDNPLATAEAFHRRLRASRTSSS
ncbi:Thiamin-phosphate pyrophosphorylase [Planctomycetales bacterium 10988]|nr:Thiamin-phosphate pyrophosphorylase [Planctomycetales bacterium 10988]